MYMVREGGAFTKTVTFACIHFTVAFSVAYLLTGNAAISSALALIEPMANTVAYYFHERIWRRIQGTGAQTPDAAYPRHAHS